MRKPTRPETIFLNMYQDAIDYEKRYEKRLQENGHVSHTMLIRRSVYKERQEQVIEAIEAIKNPRIRTIFFEKCVNGRSCCEIAKMLNLSPATVSRYYYRSLDNIMVPEEVREKCQSH